MFEYKVRAKHRLGFKEFKFYADTDIEEFLNRNSIEYVRNITDTIENKQQKEIERLNNIINELEEDIKDYREILEQGITDKVDYIYLGSVLQFLDNSLDKLQELKGDGSNENK